MRTSRGLAVVLPLAGLLLIGCAGLRTPSFAPGTAMSEVESRMGRPGNVLRAADGDTVWQYPTGPAGQTTFIVRFGPDQRTKAAYQALTVQEFAKIKQGNTREQVRLLIGPPGETMRFERMNEEVWSYRYQVSGSDNRIFNVHFDVRAGQVRRTTDQFDPLLSPWDMSASNT
jgi:hypothetical protein